jgi:hypothetical protein
MTLAGASRASRITVRRWAELEWGAVPLVSEIKQTGEALGVHPAHLLRASPSAAAVLFGQDFDAAEVGLQEAAMRVLRSVGRVVLRVVGFGGCDAAP